MEGRSTLEVIKENPDKILTPLRTLGWQH